MIADEPMLSRQLNSFELQQFAPGYEDALKNNAIKLKAFNYVCPECLRFYYIRGGNSDSIINSKNHIVNPANLAIILHGQGLYTEENYLEASSLYCLNLHLNIQKAGSKDFPGKWSNTSPYLPGKGHLN